MPKKSCPIARFHEKYIPEPTTGCWLWLGNTRSGYGLMHIRPRQVMMHRFSYELFYGKIPKGMFVCHKCDVRSCVNPQHLFVGSQKDNLRDASNKKRLRVNNQNGEKNAFAKLNNDIILNIRNDFASGYRQRDLCKKYNLTDVTIHNVVRRKIWAHI